MEAKVHLHQFKTKTCSKEQTKLNNHTEDQISIKTFFRGKKTFGHENGTKITRKLSSEKGNLVQSSTKFLKLSVFKISVFDMEK